jgi:hypothetical protein
MKNQKTAAFEAIVSVITGAGIEFIESVTIAKDVMSKEMRGKVNEILFTGFRAGEIELGREYDDKELKSYVSGLQTNWLNKDDRLTGGVKHVAKNPGSRAGSGDAQLKALRGLLTKASDADEKAEIQGYIDARLEAIGANKKKTVEVNYDDLPEELRAKYEVK